MKYRCGNCGKKGHNARSCGAKKKKTPARKKSSGGRRSTSSRGRGRSLIGRGSGWIVLHYAGRTSKGNASNKTWSIKVSGTKVVTRWGKSWGEKRETPHKFATREAAVAFADRKIREKLNKGYCILGRNRR